MKPWTGDVKDGKTEQMRGRIGSALLRVASLKASVDTESPRALEKRHDEYRRLSEELEQGFLELQEAMRRCVQAQRLAIESGSRADLLIELAPVACLLIDGTGVVLEANPAAGRALNMSHGRLSGKSFLLFMNGEREQFLGRVATLARGDHPSRWSITLRPRDQSSSEATVVAAPQNDGHIMILLLPAGEHASPDRSLAPFADKDAHPAHGGVRLDGAAAR